MPSLYPTINLPTLINPRAANVERKYKPAPFFDFDSGTFKFDSAGRPVMANGKEAFEQWCLKACMTERYTRLAYSDKYGVEMEAAMKEPDPEAVKSSIVRAITETLMVNPATEYVKDFRFEGEGEHLNVTFTVKGREWAEESLLNLKY